MSWTVKRIGNNLDRVALSAREALEDIARTDPGRGHGSVATAIEAALRAFGSINGHSIEVETQGDITLDGRGYLTISMRTIDQDVMV